MTIEKILQEEKEYWQRQALDARKLVEMHAAATREAVAERDTLREMATKMVERLKLINDLHRAVTLSGAPWTMSHPGNLSADALRDEIQRAKDYTPQSQARQLQMTDFMAEAYYHNGSMYLDKRALSDKDAARIHRLSQPGEKHKLYILAPEGGDE